VQELRCVLAVEAVSSAWESHAVGAPAPDFVNAAVLVRTSLARADLSGLLKRIEDSLGRAHGTSALVAIDLDLLVFDHEVQCLDLWSLAYRAVPVAELLPDLRCPRTGEPLSIAAARHAAEGTIWPRPDILAAAARPRMSRTGAENSS
jgi:2-amino-4-hydroxy-6-hydroxymethyldihydropteridine diphosphokinase